MGDRIEMNLLVLGATGGIGIEIVRQSITRGHTVTAFVRSPERLSPFEGRISIATGDTLDASELARVTRGQDAVLSAFGPRVPIAKTDTHLLRNFAASLTDAMNGAGARRAIVVSTAFLFKDALMPPTYLFGRLFFPGVVEDATGMEATLSASGLDIAIVRPPQLTDKPRTGKIRVRDGHLPAFGFSIPRADVAEFMIRTAENGAFAKSVVGISS
jgi:putative NADH-flavin reductase